ncbi:1-hydroxycarotenoid 3,4-desaturase CrtD [Primorskyibacter sp. S187A]|uniref:1-hydroxycarotenoid 3,4-desaturase CrtD n=1 Tax=Primorskyibacter sp. S187A TaxID=3415130 RepID=UPI003C7B3277
MTTAHRDIVIGAGMGGLATAIRLAAAGRSVLVLDRHAAPGGRARQVPSPAGPVDAGPTVLTMRWVFDELFACAGEALEDHVTLHTQDLLARHWWPDGSTLDLYADEAQSMEAVRAFAGDKAARQFHAFTKRAACLFEAFDAPLMRAASPSIPHLVKTVAQRPALLRQMAPLSTLAQSLARSFDDPRLQQLFGRYATYVGGSPYQSPAVLALIWHAEASGVHVVEGGMHRLARAMMQLAEKLGVTFQFENHVEAIIPMGDGLHEIKTAHGTHQTKTVVFNGDPRALATGALGEGVGQVAKHTRDAPRSLSANVWSFAATPTGPRADDLAYHNVFFCADPAQEFSDLKAGQMPRNPTLYICAEDRGTPTAPPDLERFEIIMNAPPLEQGITTRAEEAETCLTRTFPTLRAHGLTFDPIPQPRHALTGPQGFDRLFPATQGSLYGQSPHGTMAAFQRPQARTKIPGLYLCGGGTHPGAGVPMSALSGAHAAEAILTDQTSPSRFRPTATPGGISTPSPIAGPVQSRSSPS